LLPLLNHFEKTKIYLKSTKIEKFLLYLQRNHIHMLDKEFQYYLDHQDELVKEYNGKFIVIKGESVIGSYDTEIQAYTETIKEHELGTFLIQFCSPGKGDYSQSFHSRVVFA